jgi:hypothetical protein
MESKLDKYIRTLKIDGVDTPVTKVNTEFCPYCGAKADAQKALQYGRRPKKGDITLCSTCAGICEFNENLELIPASDALMDELRRDSYTWAQVIRAINLIRQAHIKTKTSDGTHLPDEGSGQNG